MTRTATIAYSRRYPIIAFEKGAEESDDSISEGGGGRRAVVEERDKDSFLRFEILGRDAEPEEWAGRLGLIITMGERGPRPGPSSPPGPWQLCMGGAARATPSPGHPRPKGSQCTFVLRRTGGTPHAHEIRQIGGISQAPGTHAGTVHSGRRHWPGHVFDSHLSRRVSPLVNPPIFWAGSRRALRLASIRPFP